MVSEGRDMMVQTVWEKKLRVVDAARLQLTLSFSLADVLDK